jgi:Chaperone of endosialidase/Major tropism determinant N-terminal domain
MALEITSNSVVKILVRRGLEVERKNILLSEGELGYSVDSGRLFIGDGFTIGGNPVGSKNFGIVNSKNNLQSLMQTGDFVGEAGTLYFKDLDGDFQPIVPNTYIDANTTYQTVEYATSPSLSLRLSKTGLGEGFAVDYSTEGNGSYYYTIQRKFGQVNLDARYSSLCASAGSWYFGNIFNKTVKNNLEATVNVADDFYINESNPSPYQLQFFAKDPVGSAGSVIDAVSGNLFLRGKTGVSLIQNLPTNGTAQISINNTGAITLASNKTGQGYSTPGTTVTGVTRFLSSVYIDQNCWVAGSLSAAELVSIKTSSTSTSALSVFTFDTLTDTAFIGNGNPLNTQNILRVVGNPGTGIADYFTVKDDSKGSGGCNVLVNQGVNQNGNYTVGISGSVGITSTNAAGATSDRVDITTGTLKINASTASKNYSTSMSITAPVMTLTNTTSLGITTGSLSIQGGATNTIIKSNAGGVTDYVDIQGNLRVTRDITAYYSSDLRFKDNTTKIPNALNKISILNGVYFDWNKISGKEGSSYGIIAQDVEQVLPEAVITRDDGYKAVN